jgi:outer membrane protein, heavy metal efflux system
MSRRISETLFEPADISDSLSDLAVLNRQIHRSHSASMTTPKFSLIVLVASSLSARLPAEDLPFGRVEQAVQERTRETVRWEKDQAARQQTLQRVRQLVRRPLTMNSAVQIALLNNQSLQAIFEEIGLSAADLQEAETIPNPRFNISARFPDKPPSGTDVEYSGAIDFLNILMIPLKRRVAKEQVDAAALRLADETLKLIAEVKIAFYQLLASKELLTQFELVADTEGAALDLAQRQHQAGNINDLALARQQIASSRSHLAVINAEADIRRNRAKHDTLMGLWGPDTNWQIAGTLPTIPSSDLSRKGLERLAVTQRLDLQAAYIQVTALAKAVGLTKDFRFLGALEFGVDSERQSDSQTITGPTFAIELPIFNQGQARIARSEAALRQAQKKLEALVVEVRSQVRELLDELESKREIARFYQEELLPNEARILSQSILNYNAMAIGNFELFTAKTEEKQAEREYIDAIKEYWITRAELERALGGNINRPGQGENKSVTPPGTALSSAASGKDK